MGRPRFAGEISEGAFGKIPTADVPYFNPSNVRNNADYNLQFYCGMSPIIAV